VYDGAGRFYDAALGLYLQPDPFGAAPEAPESLNRYAAPGVSTFPTVGSVPGSGSRLLADFANSLKVNYAQAVVGKQIYFALSTLLEPYAMRRTWRAVLEEYPEFVPKHRLLDTALSFGYLTQKALKRGLAGSRIGDALLSAHQRFLDRTLLKNSDVVLKRRWRQFDVVVNNTRFGRGAARLLGESGEAAFDLGLGMTLDVGLQAVNDWGMWRSGQLTGPQYVGRVVSAGAGGALGWWAGGVTAGFVAGGPGGAVVGAVAGAVVGILVEVLYELVIEPLAIYPFFGLNPKEK
jgi:hypothetical protein